MKILLSIMIAVALLMTGLAIGFQAGKINGFETGSEWAIIQAGLLAREAGVYMPVHLDENGFRVVIKQPRGLYKKTRERAEHYDIEHLNDNEHLNDIEHLNTREHVNDREHLNEPKAMEQQNPDETTIVSEVRHEVASL